MAFIDIIVIVPLVLRTDHYTGYTHRW